MSVIDLVIAFEDEGGVCSSSGGRPGWARREPGQDQAESATPLNATSRSSQTGLRTQASTRAERGPASTPLQP